MGDEDQQAAVRGRIRALTEDDIKKARIRDGKDNRCRLKRIRADEEEEEESTLLSTTTWVHDGVEAEQETIFDPNRSFDLRKLQVVQMTKAYTEANVSPHCTLRRYHEGSMPKLFTESRACCFDCAGSDCAFPCNKCKLRAAKSKRATLCRRLCPDNVGILVWTFSPPQNSTQLPVDPSPAIPLMRGVVQGRPARPSAPPARQPSRTTKPNYITAFVFEPAVETDGNASLASNDMRPIAEFEALVELFDPPEDASRALSRSYQPFFHSTSNLWTVSMFDDWRAHHNTFVWTFDPTSGSEDNGRSYAAAMRLMQEWFPKSTATKPDLRALGYSFHGDMRQPSFLAVATFVLFDMWDATEPLDPLNENVTTRLLSAALCSKTIASGSHHLSMRAPRNPATVLREIDEQHKVLDSQSRFQVIAQLLHDTERVTTLLASVYSEVEQTFGQWRSTTSSCKNRLSAIYRVWKFMERDLSWYRSALAPLKDFSRKRKDQYPSRTAGSHEQEPS